MKKKNKIIIGIAIVVLAIIAVIVGITANNHQNAVKEAESISVSVEASKNDLITSYTKQFTDITSKEYKTEDEYSSAKNLLISLKDEINKNDEIKDNNEIVSLIKNIDSTIKDYDEKIKSLSTTKTTIEEVAENDTTTKNTSSNKTTIKNSSSKTNSNNSQQSKTTTTMQSTTKETTTKEKYKSTPSYGTVVTTRPNFDDYDTSWGWKAGIVTCNWWDGNAYDYNIMKNMSPSEFDEWIKYAEPYFPEPDFSKESGSSEITIWVWLG